MTVLSVAAGGAIGAVLRYLLVAGVARALGPVFPTGVLAANVVGCFAMGVLAVTLTVGGVPAARFAPFLMTGVLGGFTTFSAFALDATRLAEEGRLELSALYILLSVVLSIGALTAGMALGRAMTTGAGA
jgi:CrcB protein